jgi:hypothetical protein
MEPCQHQQCKRHAQLRHQPRSTPLWVGDPDDWALVRHEPRPPLVCPEPGCEVELISYENLNNQFNPRIFKFKPGKRSCDHWSARGEGGGPESVQHEWMKLRLARIAKMLGYTATPEHVPSHADVFVHDVSFCLEVQLNPTRFRQRTAARQAKGAKVCWLIREGLDSEKALKALFGLPAVRFRVVDLAEPGRLLTPWDRPTDRDLAYRARLQVFGTIAYPPRANNRPDPTTAGARWFHTGTMDGYQFLEEILSGRRRWYRPNVLGHKSGLWALKSDVTEYFAFRDQDPEVAKQATRLGDVTPSASPPDTGGDSPAPESASQLSQRDLMTFDDPPTAVGRLPPKPAVRHGEALQEQSAAPVTAAASTRAALGPRWRRWWPFRRR